MALLPCRRFVRAGTLRMRPIANSKRAGGSISQRRWGRDFAAALGRTNLTCLAFNTAQVSRLQAGERLASMAIRRLRRHRQRELGSAPAVLYVVGCDARLLVGRIARCAWVCPAGESSACLSQAVFP